MTLFGWLAWGEWRAQPVRNALSVVAIAIGVALGFAVHLVNAVALDNFTGGLNRIRGSADLQIVGTSNRGFDETLYTRLHDGTLATSIAVASPIVERDVVLSDADIALRVTGADFLNAVRVTPVIVGRPEADHRTAPEESPASPGNGWFDADAIFVTQALLDATKKRIGDPLDVQVASRVVTLRIAGLLGEDDDAAAPSSQAGSRRLLHASMDIGGAQWQLDRLGRLTRIDLRLVEGADLATVRAAIAAILPPDAQVVTAADDRARTGDLSRAYRVNLDMLALMALFTGAFLVYSTQSLAVARRRAQLALLRVIGVTRGRVVAQVLAEGTLQGIVGGALGLVAGVAFAAAALRFLGGDLGGGFFAKSTGFDLHRLVFAAPAAAVLFFVLGLGAALVGSFFPARAAARAAPAVALKSAGGDAGLGDSVGRASPWLALGLIVASALCAALPAIGGLPIAGYVGMMLLLFGGIAAMPWIVRLLLAPLARSERPRAVAIDLALRRLWAAPSAASVALCGIVASASMMVAMTVMIGSFRHSVDAWLGQVLQADLYLRTGSAGEGGLAPEDVDRMRRVDGVRRIELQKVVPLALSPSRPPVSLVVRSVDTAEPDKSLPLIASTSTAPVGDAVPVWVSEAMVDLYGARVGQPFALPIVQSTGTGAAARYVVAGVWRDYARQFGSVVIRREDYTRLTGDARFTDAGIDLVPAASAQDVTERLRAALPDRLRKRAEFAEPGAIRKLSLAIFDRSFAVTYLLQAVAIAIGLAGVAATFSAQTLARSKEFGMLRHIGVLKRQIVAELATEGALLGVLGALAGGVLGLATSQVLIHVVNPQSFHWTMDTWIPWSTLAAVGLALVGASAGTAAFSGRRALGHDAVLAVREDW